MSNFVKKFNKLFVLIIVLFMSAYVHSQTSNVYVYSTVDYDAEMDVVNGTLYSVPDYNNYVYYMAGVRGKVFNPANNEIADRSVDAYGSPAVANFQAFGNGCGNYRLSGGAFMISTYYANNAYYNGQYYSGYYNPYNYFDISGGMPSLDFYFRQGNGPVTYSYNTFSFLGAIESISNKPCLPPNEIEFLSASASHNGTSANFDEFNKAPINVTGGVVDACGVNGEAEDFDVNIRYRVPDDAVNIIHNAIYTYAKDDTSQFRSLGGLVWTVADVDFNPQSKIGTVTLQNIRREYPERVNNRISFKITGTRANGYRFEGTARVQLLCS